MYSIGQQRFGSIQNAAGMLPTHAETLVAYLFFLGRDMVIANMLSEFE
jgi:hypothetical protein